MTKLEKIEAINADLQAGRVSIGIDHGFEPTIPGIEQRCARCGAQIDDIAAHQERCFVVGDAVRWEYPLRSLWVEGDYIDSADRGFWTEHRLTVRAASSGWGPDEGDDTEPPVIGTKHSFGTDNHSGTNLRRIPRPGQEWRRVFQNGADRSQPCSTCGKMFGQHFGVACELPRLEDYQKPWDLQQAVAQQSADIGRRLREFRDATMKHLAEPMPRRVCCPGAVCGCWSSIAKPPAPTLYDGLTAEQCLERFIWLQRDAKDTPLAGTHRRDALTGPQRDIARFLWSTQLRAKVDASRSAERHQVVLDDVEALLAGCREAE